VFISGGITHASFGGIGIGLYTGISPLLSAAIFSVLSAFGVEWLSKRKDMREDSAIAVFSTTALAIGILVSSKAGLTNDVSHYMFGSILAMNHDDVILSVILSVIVLIIFIVFYHKIFAVTFDESFSKATGIKIDIYKMIIALLTAVTVVLGMMMMGALLISSLIIFPAITSMRLFKSFKSVVISSAIISVSCFLVGFFISLLFDTAPGASVVVVNAVTFLVFTLISMFKNIKK
jgi:zinc transport system permease protein